MWKRVLCSNFLYSITFYVTSLILIKNKVLLVNYEQYLVKQQAYNILPQSVITNFPVYINVSL